MGERRESNPNKRMLFTEFGSPGERPDASAVDDRARRPFPVASLPTLEELASSLDLDFEDDSESIPPHSRASGDTPNKKGAPFASPALNAVRPSIEADDSEETRFFNYAPFVREAFAGIGPDETEELAAGEPADVGDASMDLDDILSAVPPTIMGDADGMLATTWRGQRLGVEPPPATPYGGIERVDEWYRPPERGEGPDSVTIRENPRSDPRPPAGDAMSNRGSASAIFSDLDLASIWEERIASANERNDEWADSEGGDKVGTRIAASKPSREERTIVMPATHDAAGRPGQERTREISRQAEGKRGAETTMRTMSVPEERPPESGAGRGGAKAYRRPALSIDAGGSGFLDDDVQESAPALSGDIDAAAAGISADVGADDSPGAEAATSVLRSEASGDIAFQNDANEAGRPLKEASRTTRDQNEPATGDLAKETPPDESYQENDDEYLPEAEQDAEAETGDGQDAEAETGDGQDDSIGQSSGLVAVPSRAGLDSGAPAGRDAGADAFTPEGGGGPGRGDEIASILADDADAAAMTGMAAPPLSPLDEADALANDAAVGSGGSAESFGAAAAVNPEDVFSNFDDMDFEDDGLDEEMKAMLDEGDGQSEAEKEQETPLPGQEAILDAPPPADAVGKAVYVLRKMVFRIIPADVVKKSAAMIAWRENWWFYCDLLAAIIASASLAIIISYFIWYRK